MAVDASASAPKSDIERLHELGYAQELGRKMQGFSNMAVSFSIISILAGCLTVYYLALYAGAGPSIAYGWPIVVMGSLLVAMSMGEVCSHFPTAGGLYYWSAKLAKRNAPFWSWTTGWFNLIGQVAVTASVDFALANFFGGFLSLVSDFEPTKYSILAIYAMFLIVHGVLNSLGIRLIALLNDISVWWHLGGVAVFLIFLVALPDEHASASFVFAEFQNNTGFNGRFSGIYVFGIGMLMAQYTITGFDASAHMSEETENAAVAGPKGMVTSVWLSGVAGYILLLALTFAIAPGFDFLTAAGGLITAPIPIIEDAIGADGAKLLVGIACVAQFFCGNACLTANSRMVYAFSRDGAVPGHRLWHRINPRTRTPTNSIWFCVALAFIAGLFSLRDAGGFPATFFAIVSLGVIGLYISYIIPVFLRLRQGESFERGPWHLGRWSYLVGWAAVAWVVLISLLFLVPQFSPITWASFNYTPVALGGLMVFVFGYWLLGARKWFKGPQVMGTPEELAALEAELEAVAAGKAPVEEFTAMEDEMERRPDERD